MRIDMKSLPGMESAPDGALIDFNDISIESMGGHIIFGDVDEETMKDACAFVLKANQLFSDKELTLFINTLGGAAYDGFALIDLMNISRLDIKTVGMGCIMSMGVLLLAAGTKGKRILTKNTTVMAHQFSSGSSGKFHELMQSYKADVYLKFQIIQHFKQHTTMTEKQIEDILFGASDRYLTPTECKKFGICDRIVDELPEFNLDLGQQVKRKPVLARAPVSKRRSG